MPTPAAPPAMTGLEPVPPGSPGAMPGAGVTPQQAGNFVRNLETPKYGVDAYVQSRIAEGAGSREMRGNSRKGFVYTAGPYKGLTEGQAMERARREYAGMNPQERAGYEQRAQGNDVMSATERAQTNQNYAARGVAAMGAAGMPVAGNTAPTAAGVSSGMPSPTPAPSAPGIQPVLPGATAKPQGLGSINGTPVELIRAMNETKRNQATKAAIEPTFEDRWRSDYRQRFGQDPKSEEERAQWKADVQQSLDRAPKGIDVNSPEGRKLREGFEPMNEVPPRKFDPNKETMMAKR